MLAEEQYLADMLEMVLWTEGVLTMGDCQSEARRRYELLAEVRQ